jgi:hypothetical protein
MAEMLPLIAGVLIALAVNAFFFWLLSVGSVEEEQRKGDRR